MIENKIIFESQGGSEIVPPNFVRSPSEFIELVGLRSSSIEHRLGYFRDEPYVIFGYCPGGGEVIWKDGHSSGFGTGGWKTFLWEIAPLAARNGANLGSVMAAGSHVLLLDRARQVVYAAPRKSAEDFLARVNGIASPMRLCLCGMLDCASCPIKSCPNAGVAHRPEFAKPVELETQQ